MKVTFRLQSDFYVTFFLDRALLEKLEKACKAMQERLTILLSELDPGKSLTFFEERTILFQKHLGPFLWNHFESMKI